MGRDTDKDWNEIGRTHPYYGVLTNPRFLDPRPDDLQEFFSSGERDIASILERLVEIFGPFEPRTALDFGCGVGRLLIPLAKTCGSAYGVDISEPMLALAEKHCREAGVQFELGNYIPAGRQFELVNSLIVLQHILPTKGYQLIKKLWNAVAPDGCMSLHLGIYKDSRHVGELIRDLETFTYDGETILNFSGESDGSAGMSMYDYNLSLVFASLSLPIDTRVLMQKTDFGGCHGVIMYLRKANFPEAY
jgi:SAM-dependent methyltransferase